MADIGISNEIKLSAFRFARQDASAARHQPDGGAIPSTKVDDYIFSPSHASGRSSAYERMATDKPGQELAEDATIWNLYLDEANEYDQELVKGRHASLDMLLLFAALFSAILTAFLIESKKLLQQDPMDISVSFQLLVAQSQLRMELGLPPPANLTASITVPNFTPALSARWINGIWFTSLTLSLAAALVAMLGKEWLTAFLRSRPRPAHDYAMLRQSRLEGLERWWALHIIALLPSLLHAALLLFSVGLVIYLWTMDTIISSVVVGIIGATFLFYFATAILGAAYEFCPFVTEVSAYLRYVLYKALNSSIPTDPTRDTFHQDLRALLWLANNASDPTVRDCSYQALAGLRGYTSKVQAYNADFKSKVSEPLKDDIPLQLNKETTMISLLSIVSERFERIMTNRGALAMNEGAHAVRYAAAVCNITIFLKYSNSQTGRGIVGYKRPFIIATDKKQSTEVVKSKILPFKPLALIENLWANNTPPLSPSAYSGFLAIELELLSIASIDLVVEMSDLKQGPPEPSDRGAGLFAEPDMCRINIIPTDSYARLDYRLAILRAYYSRTLARVTQILRLHLFGEISLESNSLIGLMNSVCTAARCDALNPIDSISTHHPTVETPELPVYHFAIPISHNDTITIRPDDLRAGPLGIMIYILRIRPNMTEDSLLEAQLSVLDAFSSLAPVLFQQLLALNRTELVDAFNFRSWSYKPKADLLGIGYIVVRQMLLTLRHLGAYLETSTKHMAFYNDVMQLIYEYIQEFKGNAYNQGPWLAVAQNCLDFVPMLEYASANESNLASLPDNIVVRTLHLSRLPIGPGPMTPCEIGFTPMCFPSLIRMVTRVNVSVASAREIFEAMIRRLHKDNSRAEGQESMAPKGISSVDYLRVFTHTDYGFSALVNAASRSDIEPLTVELILKICHMASGRDRVPGFESIEISPVTIPGFSAAISIGMNYMIQVDNVGEDFLAFLEDSFVLVMVASEDDTSKAHLMEHSVYQELYDACRSANDTPRAQALRQSIYIQGVQLGIGFEEWHSTEREWPAKLLFESS